MAKKTTAPPDGVEPPASRGVAVNITAPNLQVLEILVRGTAPLCVNNFSHRKMMEMHAKHEQGSVARKGSLKKARDFEEEFEGARHRFGNGHDGFHAGAIRAAAISACRLVGFKMTLAKMCLFVEADGFDCLSHVPLIRIIAPEPERYETMTRTETGVINLAIRPLWPEWGARLRLKFDADQFSSTDVTNLIQRVGHQVGLCEGRPDSKNSAGIGFGTFRLLEGGETLDDLEDMMPA